MQVRFKRHYIPSQALPSSYYGPSIARDLCALIAKGAMEAHQTADPPPLKWSDLRYVFDIQEDCNGKEAIQA